MSAFFMTTSTYSTSTTGYYDARVRLEGLDITLQALSRPDARPSDVESPPASLRLVHRDYINVLILMAVAVIRAFLNNFWG
jgi:hypothetical protein